jgi:hypothetical protein
VARAQVCSYRPPAQEVPLNNPIRLNSKALLAVPSQKRSFVFSFTMADTDEQAKLAVNKRPHAAIEDEEDGA